MAKSLRYTVTPIDFRLLIYFYPIHQYNPCTIALSLFNRHVVRMVIGAANCVLIGLHELCFNQRCVKALLMQDAAHRVSEDTSFIDIFSLNLIDTLVAK